MRKSTAIDLACALAAVAPLLLTAHLPLYDLPNHVAMLHVLLDYPATPALHAIYAVHWAFIPNMALQLITWLLHHFVSIETAVRLFCIATVLLLCAGTRALAMALAGDAPPLHLYRAAPLLCWGAPLQFGFVGYCMGIGLMLLALALYIRRRHQPWPRLAVLFMPIAIVLLAAHLMVWGLFVVCLAGCECAACLQHTLGWAARVRWLCRRAGPVIALNLPALVLLLAAPSLANTASPGYTHAAKMSGLLFKAQSVAAITWFAMPWVEIPLLLAAATCLGLALRARLVRPHILAGGMLALLCLAWLILPRDVAASAYVDYRAPWAIGFVLLGGLGAGRSAPLAASRPLAHALALTMAVLVVARIGSVCARALYVEPDMEAVDRALASLPAGTSLWVVKGKIAGSLMKTPPLEHTAAYIVSRRDGFEAQAFAGAPGQLVSLQPRYRLMYCMEAPAVLKALPPGYDAVLVLNPQLVAMAAATGLRVVSSGRHFLLLAR